MPDPAHPFRIVPAAAVERWIAGHAADIFDIVRATYLAHQQGRTVSPDSHFLRFPDSDRNRIIALPASLEDDRPVAGLKWIASFPGNVDAGADRASALLILNDRHTGYPLACMEGAQISAARTAGSAAVGAHYLHPTPRRVTRLGVVGCGPIAFGTVSLLVNLGWEIGSVRLTDLSEDRAALFAERLAGLGLAAVAGALADTIGSSDLVVFATSAVTPYVHERSWFAHAPTVLHMSLRDLAPDILLSAQNLADDVEHCLKARTSLDLACQQQGGDRSFIDGGIAAAILGTVAPDRSRPRIFSPFGMGVLDLAVARAVLDTLDDGEAVVISDFFPRPYAAGDRTPERSAAALAATVRNANQKA